MKRLLVVDDNADHVSMTSLMLRKQYAVEGCFSLVQFQDAVHRTRPDGILLDLHVGMHHAADFVRALQDAGTADIPVVLVSGSEDIQRKAAELGCVAFLQKPYALQALRTVLADALSIIKEG